MHILLIEDDQRAAEYLLKGLTECRHIVDHATDGETGLHLALSGEYDVIIADRMLPKRDGLSIIRLLRADQKFTPVLVLSALGTVDDRIDGLRAGSDDYLVKPYAFSELLARLEALVRRSQPQIQPTHRLQYADLVLDLHKQKVTRKEQVIPLQPQEFRVLEYLLLHSEQVVTRTMLLENVWELHFDPQTNVIDVQMCRLRSKIDKGFKQSLLHTIRGSGYKLSKTA